MDFQADIEIQIEKVRFEEGKVGRGHRRRKILIRRVEDVYGSI